MPDVLGDSLGKWLRDDARLRELRNMFGMGGISFDTKMSVVLIEADFVFENTVEDRQ